MNIFILFSISFSFEVVEFDFEKRIIEGDWEEDDISEEEEEDIWICKILLDSKCCCCISFNKINELIGMIEDGRIQRIELEPSFHDGKRFLSNDDKNNNNESELKLFSSEFDCDEKLFGREKIERIRIKLCGFDFDWDFDCEEICW